MWLRWILTPLLGTSFSVFLLLGPGAVSGTSEALQHLAVARFILAGASDVPVAIEETLQFRIPDS